MMRLYYRAGTGRPIRVAWELEELGVEYEPVALSGEECAGAEHLERHPLGRVPALTFDDGATLFESTAIVLAVADLYPEAGLIGPLGSPLRVQVYGWSIMAMTELEPAAINARFVSDVSDEYRAAQRRRFGAAASSLDGPLSKHEFLLGDSLTAADIVVGGVLAVGDFAGVLDAAPDRVGAYFERLRGRPAFARAGERTESLLAPS
jgi:glutathione S-transferase